MQCASWSRTACVASLACLALLGSPSPAQAQPGQPRPTAAALRTLSLEELGNLVVTSVSKEEETRSTAAAAVAVITNEDIRRSGATTIPGVLRLVPGLHVARQTSNIWAVSSRGFSSQNSEKLLVLSDTRSVYTPLYSGVFWDAQDLMLEDVDRIEVIRGPGAALWGSNAVNGVINITTKSAVDTQGTYVALSGGNEEQFAVNGRYGGRLGDTAYYRVFGKFTARDSTFFTGAERDDWQLGRGGARMDWYPDAANTVTLQGSFYGGDIGRLFPSISVEPARSAPVGPLRTDISGGNVLARWSRRSQAGSETQVRVYYDRTHRNDPSFVDDLDTIDADMQHRMLLPARQELTWGANYRVTSNRNEGKGVFALDPPSSTDQVYSGFVQHQVELTDTLRLTSGTKLEHNDFSGGDVQPSIRASWHPRQHTVWGAVSRAIRIPTRLERDLAVDVTDPAGNPVVRLLGNREFAEERLVAFEAGYRWQYSALLLVDLATYYDRYGGLAALEQATPFVTGGTLVVPIVHENLTDGRSTGLEAAVSVAPTTWWRLSANSTTMSLDLTARGSDLNGGVLLEGATPKHQFLLRSQFDLGTNVDVDAQVRHSTAIRQLPGVVTTGDVLPGYAEVDLRVAWRPSRELELAIVGQNLRHARHPEFGARGGRGELERGVYASITWRRR